MKKGQSPYRGHDLREWLSPRIVEANAGFSTPCWIWSLTLCRKGYARWRLPAKFGYGKRTVALHRVYYEQLVGPIPEGLVIDHLCRNRACLNPGHLEPVSSAENTRRGVHPLATRNSCEKGHPYPPSDPDNVSKGKRRCRICSQQYVRDSRLRKVSREGRLCLSCGGGLSAGNVSGYCSSCVNARLRDIAPCEDGKLIELRARVAA